MDWKKTIGNIAPTIGAVFGAPGIAVGAAIRSILNMSDTSTDEEVKAAIATPEGQEKIRLAEIAYKSQVLQANSANIQAVNTTMQAESKSEHWMQWAWRPFNGFLFGVTLFCNYALPTLINSLILPFLSIAHTAILSNPVPEGVFMAWGAVLGVTAWHRGLMQVEQAKK